MQKIRLSNGYILRLNLCLAVGTKHSREESSYLAAMVKRFALAPFLVSLITFAWFIGDQVLAPVGVSITNKGNEADYPEMRS